MERLIKDAAKLDETVDANSMSLDNIIKAIHAVQVSMDITGTSLDEAEKTIQGSTNAMGAAWQNLLDALSAKPEDDLPIGEAVQKFADSALTSYDILLQTVERALIGIGEMIDQIIPPLMDRLPEFVNEALPKLVEAGAKMITSILTGISDNLPEIMKGAMSILNVLIKTYVENYPTLFKIGVDTLIELVRGITKELPQIIEACITIIDTIVNELTNEKTLNELLDVSLEFIVTLVEGLTNSNAIPKLLEACITIIKTVARVLTSPENLTKILNSAAKIVLGLAEGIIKALPDLATGWLQIIEAIISGIQDTDWGEVGGNIVNGIWEGLKDSWGKVGNWLGEKWNGLVGQANKILEIGSPSKVFKKIGGYTAEGFKIGWEDEFDDAQKTIENDLSFNVDHNIQPTNQNSVMPVMPNITLHIDKFVNNTDDDIEELADKLSEVMSQKTYRNEVIFA
jgi:hypothetical protein